MPNPLYNSLNQINNASNLISQMNALRSNPVQFLAQRRFNLPQNFTGGPQQIVQYLLDTGQMSQNQYNNLISLINR